MVVPFLRCDVINPREPASSHNPTRIGSNNNFGETSMKTWLRTVAATAAIVSTCMLSNTASAAGRTLYVTTDGTDSASCGAQTSSCRSITQGIENAADGDTILVGAGKY